jgi:hypothetical protein
MFVFINGSINAGKSTVAKLLSQRLTNCVVIEPDQIREEFADLPIDKAVPLVMEKLAVRLKEINDSGKDAVVPYPLSTKNAETIVSCCRKLNSEIKVFSLDPGLEVAVSDRGARRLTEWEVDRIKKHYGGLIDLKLGTVINNDNEKPEQTAERILREIRR